ncbi:hypothetical protein PIB30_061492 [Stylosanthes scabra]|uniref:Uncharacterized protein n=1 Tax=Stylosanthes scabra TaxID=79078 RepID=A0ABU6RM00_9FABA|nr:hypothetical protein [Stylosanthes scabra]
MDPCGMGLFITEICLGKFDCFKRATYLEDVLDPLSRHYNFETTPTFSTIGYDFVELESTSKLKDGS